MALINGIPLINGVEYAWGDIVTVIAGAPVTGITAIDYDDDQDVKNNYGAGRYPISRSKGRITPTSKVTLTMDEILAIQRRSLNGRIQDIAPFDIIVSYLPENGIIVIDKIRNCQFKKNKRAWKEGDTRQEVELELVISHIDWDH